MLMDTKGELIRGTRGSRVLLDQVAEIDLIVNQLPEVQKQVVVEHYLNRDSLPEQKYRHCGCAMRTYYLRLRGCAEFCVTGVRVTAAAGGLRS